MCGAPYLGGVVSQEVMQMPSNHDGGRPSALPPSQSDHNFQRFTLSRGEHERPLQFDGLIVAEAQSRTGDGHQLRAAIYRTSGGQHVSEFSRQDTGGNVTGKAVAFPTLDAAVVWFRPGKLTTTLLRQLGRWDPDSLDESATIAAYVMPLTDELEQLLAEPNETLSAEYKSWLNLREMGDRARLAKAAIALANHGGGVIVLGMRAQSGGPLESVKRPSEVTRYTLDEVNHAINRFAEPEIHCDLSFAMHPTTAVEHAFVQVPGGMTVPVFSSRAHEKIIAQRVCYIRKPGPKSEEPFDATEWGALMERCLRARRDDRRADMLDAIRNIVQGAAGGGPTGAMVQAAPANAPAHAVGDALTGLTTAARRRWSRLVEPLPADDPARFPLGHYELGFEIVGDKSLTSLTELRAAMRQAGSLKHTGWGPFVQLSRVEYEPRIVDGAIETWLGAPGKRVLGRDPAHVDYWRADAGGQLVQLRGYDEDGTLHRTPGTLFDITLPVWRVGEAILYVGRLAELYGDDLSFLVRCRYQGLRGRVLTSLDRRRMIFDDRRCADDEVTLERQVTRAQARDNLVEVLHALLSPLYERFAFFELSERLVTEEVERLTSGRF
jgi:hypothetical protein